MKIRFAEEKDKEMVLELLDELITFADKNYRDKKRTYNTSNEAKEPIFNQLIQRDDVKIFVVEEDGQLIGLAELFIVPILRRGYHQGVIETFIITEKMRGKGFGSKLLRHIIAFCKENNMRVVKLNSSNENVNAHQFYEKHGGKFTEKLYRFDLT